MLPLYAAYYLQLSPTQSRHAFHHLRRDRFRHDHSRRFSHGPRRPEMVHGAEHRHSCFGVSANSHDEKALFTSRFSSASSGWRKVYRSALWPLRPTTSCRRTRAARLQALRRTIAELGSGAAPLIGGCYGECLSIPARPFWFMRRCCCLSATLLAVVGKETLER